MTTIPHSFRQQLDIEPGDRLRWDVDGDGRLSVEIVRQRYGAFDDDDLQADLGSDTQHDVAGSESDPAIEKES